MKTNLNVLGSSIFTCQKLELSYEWLILDNGVRNVKLNSVMRIEELL